MTAQLFCTDSAGYWARHSRLSCSWLREVPEERSLFAGTLQPTCRFSALSRASKSLFDSHRKCRANHPKEAKPCPELQKNKLSARREQLTSGSPAIAFYEKGVSLHPRAGNAGIQLNPDRLRPPVGQIPAAARRRTSPRRSRALFAFTTITSDHGVRRARHWGFHIDLSRAARNTSSVRNRQHAFDDWCARPLCRRLFLPGTRDGFRTARSRDRPAEGRNAVAILTVEPRRGPNRTISSAAVSHQRCRY